MRRLGYERDERHAKRMKQLFRTRAHLCRLVMDVSRDIRDELRWGIFRTK